MKCKVSILATFALFFALISLSVAGPLTTILNFTDTNPANATEHNTLKARSPYIECASLTLGSCVDICGINNVWGEPAVQTCKRNICTPACKEIDVALGIGLKWVQEVHWTGSTQCWGCPIGGCNQHDKQARISHDSGDIYSDFKIPWKVYFLYCWRPN
jgi:hypothetical protein